MEPAIAKAVADRTAIDWDALVDRASDAHGRAALHALRQLDESCARPSHSRPASPGSLAAFAVQALVLVATVQTAAGLTVGAAALGSGHAFGRVVTPLFVAGAFAASAVLLASAAGRDRRVLLLLTAFICTASAFARGLSIGLGRDPLTPLFRGVYPEAFAPAALAQFTVLFPHVRRFTRMDLWARRRARAAWALATGVFAVNVATSYGWAAGPLARLDRGHPSHAFWYIFSAAAAPAVLGVFRRARRATPVERRRVRGLAYTLAAGMTPFLLMAAARLAVPGVEAWLRSATGVIRMGVDVIVVGALAAMPLLASMAVIVDRPFGAPVLTPPTLWRRLGRTRARLTGGGLTGSVRRRRARERLAAALERLQAASGSREFVEVLRRELLFGTAARSVTFLAPSDLGADSAIRAILDASSVPVEFSRESEPLVLLPRSEREWLEDRRIRFAAALRRRDGMMSAIVLLGPPRLGDAYCDVDAWFVATLLTAAALAGTTDDDPDDAVECPRCGLVAKAGRAPCECGEAVIPARLPPVLAGKFEVARRIGSGGMGVVYLARDTALGRDVALKTLPTSGSEAMARLRDEARAMAALNHPALATLYGVELLRGRSVLVVEYMAGGTLAARLARESMPLDEIVACGVAIADALAHMHERGMLHRDVKPSNVGMTADGAVKLLDFGLSGDEGARAGTAEYLPPEALAGGAPDAAVDLWGLAVTLRGADGGRHAELRAFFARALAEAPGDRYPSAVAVRDALLAVRSRSH